MEKRNLNHALEIIYSANSFPKYATLLLYQQINNVRCLFQKIGNDKILFHFIDFNGKIYKRQCVTF